MKFEEIEKLINFLEKSKISKFSLKEKDFEIAIEKEGEKILKTSYLENEKKTNIKESSSLKESDVKDEEVDLKKEKSFFIKSPMVGTFYASPSPEKSHFVKTGDKVFKDTVVCIIEAMKVMNEVKAGIEGIVKEVFCRNSHPVEFGTKLFEIEKV